MTPFRCMLSCLTVSALALLASLPAADAQLPCCRMGGGMHIQTYHIQYQWQQQYMQQMYQQQQMHQQRMMMHQQQQYMQQHQARMHQQQQYMQQHQARLQQQQHLMTQHAGRLQQHQHVMTQTSRQMWQTAGHLTGRGGHLTQMAGHLTQTSRHMTQTSRLMTQTSRHMTQTSRLMTQTAGRLTQKAGHLTQTAGRLTQKSGVLTQRAGQIQNSSQTIAKTRWCSKTVTITVVTFDPSCGKCHQGNTPHATTTVRGPRPQMPNLVNTPRTPRTPNMVTQVRRPSLPEMMRPGSPARTPQMVGRLNTPNLPNMVNNRPKSPPPTKNLLQRGEPQLPNLVSRPRSARPLYDPMGPGPIPGTTAPSMPYIVSSGQPMMMPNLWNTPVQTTPPPRSNLVTRMDPSRYGLLQTPGDTKARTTRTTSDLATPKKAAEKVLAEGITTAETAQPLPADVLKAPALPVLTWATGSNLQGLPGGGGHPLAEGIVDPATSALQAVQTPLSSEDLQSPALPALPVTILVLPPAGDEPLGPEDADQAPDMPTGPEAPEFTPRTPDPVAGLSPRHGRPLTRLTAENPLATPAMPNVSPSVLGPG